LSVTCDRSVVFFRYSGFLHNKTDRHDITEILLKVALKTINTHIVLNVTACEDMCIAISSWNINFQIWFVDFSDPDSGLESNDLCFGHTTRDCDEMDWTRLTFNPNISYTIRLSDGIPIWVKIKAVNRGIYDLYPHYFLYSIVRRHA
jgi:hypothetical protein